MTYKELLETKVKTHTDSGFDHSGGWAHLYPFQEFCVKLALKKGRFAMFEDCGLGKTRQQLTWANEVVKHTNKPVILLDPLAVVPQTKQEGQNIGIQVLDLELDESQLDLSPAIYIINYEQLDNVRTSEFSGVILDESSIIKNFEGAYRNVLIERFALTPYKLCCTATPSPNDPMELGNHAEFLNVMSYTEMLAMYFVHDGGETAKWRIKGHAEQLFWDFISSWSIMLSNPSDIGFSDEGYDLPALNYIEKLIITEKKNNGILFNDTAISATTHNAELRLTKIARLNDVVDIVKSLPDESFIIWVKQNEEGETLRKLFDEHGITGYFEVKGSDTPEWKKTKLLSFANNEYPILISKNKIAGFGMNFQNCHNMIFASPDFSFEALYQSIRREWRFGQVHAVNVWLIVTDTMQNVIQSIRNKQAQFEQMQKAMQLSMNRSFNKAHKKIDRENKIYRSAHADLRLGDSLQLIDTLPDESIGFSIWSPPFPELYVYSDEIEDLGNCKNYDEFMQFFSFIPEKLFRVMWSGRNVAIHCMDTPIQKGKEGYIGLRDFSGKIIEAMTAAGFIYHSRVTIWKDPVTEMQRTKALGLLHKQVKKDAAMSRVGIPDYLLVFRKPGEHDHPVKCGIDVNTWQQYASPTWDDWRNKDHSKVELMDTIDAMKAQIIAMQSGNKFDAPANFHEPIWMNIDYGETLNKTEARSENDERHICPLQLQTIERATILWSNGGDTCLSMFGGIGSEPFKFIQLNRKAIAFELKTAYFDVMVKNVKNAESLKQQATLFT